MMKTNFFNTRRVASLLCLSACIASSTAFALPDSPTVISGSVNFNDSVPGELTITTSSARSIVDWESFSVDTDELVTITFSDASSAMLSRVTGCSASDLLESLQSNGVVYLVNPNGVVIGTNCSINTNSFLASTLDVSDSDFLSGEEMNFAGAEDAGQAVVNNGAIQVGAGDVILLGYQVTNSDGGVIRATAGTIALGAGQQIAFQPTSGERIVVLTGSDTFASVTGLDSSGNIDGVVVELKADAQMYALAITHTSTGLVNGGGISTQDGRVTLRTDGGVTIVNGQITSHNNNTGGTVYVLGGTVTLDNNAYIDCSSSAGGGEVFIGGGYQGGDSGIPNAVTTTFAPGAAIFNGAGVTNDGGQVVVWADDTVTFCGSIYSDGGTFSGNGGLVEFGGVNHLQYGGNVINQAVSPFYSDGAIELDSNDIDYTACN